MIAPDRAHCKVHGATPTAPDPEVERIAYEHHGLPSDCIECPVVGESGECPRLVAFRRAVEAGRNYGWFKFNDEVVSKMLADAKAEGAREAYEACLAIARIRFERGARRLSAASIESRIRGRARGGGR